MLGRLHARKVPARNTVGTEDGFQHDWGPLATAGFPAILKFSFYGLLPILRGALGSCLVNALSRISWLYCSPPSYRWFSRLRIVVPSIRTLNGIVASPIAVGLRFCPPRAPSAENTCKLLRVGYPLVKILNHSTKQGDVTPMNEATLGKSIAEIISNSSEPMDYGEIAWKLAENGKIAAFGRCHTSRSAQSSRRPF